MAWNATVLNLAGPRAFRCPFPSHSLRRGHALKAACRELSRLLMRKDAWEVRPIGNDELRRSCLDLTRTISGQALRRFGSCRRGAPIYNSNRGVSVAEGLEYGRISFEFAEEVDRLSDADEVANSMRRTMTPFGLELFGFFARVPSPGERLDTMVLARQTPEMAEWLKIYEDGRYAEVDPIMRRLRHAVMPFEHDEVPYDADSRAVELKQRRGDFGFASGLSVPIFGSSGRTGYVSYTIFKGLKPDLRAHERRAVYLMTFYAADRICRLRAAQSAQKPVLTNRQREVLTWAAAGKSAWEMGEILNISTRTVEEHAQQALERLGAVNRTQAVAIAIRDRLIAI
jgi:LuxR family quorum sensing-dependent transcriptional regulator